MYPYADPCPYYDPSNKKCKLYDTYQSDYQITTYCRGPYWDSYKNCANYMTKKRDGAVR